MGSKLNIPQFSILLPCTLALIAGITWQAEYIVWSIFILITSLFLIYLKYKRFYSILKAITIITVFFVFGAIRSKIIIDKYNFAQENFCSERINFVAKVMDQAKSNNLNFPSKLTLQIWNVANYKKATKLESKIICIYLRETPKTKISDVIFLENMVIPKIGDKNFKLYLIKEGIFSTLFLSELKYRRLYRDKIAPSYFNATKNRLLKNLKSKMSDAAFITFSSIFLGYKDSDFYENATTKEQFNIWGISHFLARSGLHLVIILMLWNFIFSLIPIRYNLKQLLYTIIMLTYALLSWTSISFLRAFIMFLLYQTCMILRLSTITHHILTLTCCTVLIYNPFQLFFLDFQLSFALTFAITWAMSFKHKTI